MKIYSIQIHQTRPTVYVEFLMCTSTKELADDWIWEYQNHEDFRAINPKDFKIVEYDVIDTNIRTSEELN